MTRFVNRLDAACERKRPIKDDSKVFFTEMGKTVQGRGFGAGNQNFIFGYVMLEVTVKKPHGEVDQNLDI